MTADTAGVRFERVSNRVVVALGPVDGERAGSNSTIVIGRDATLVIDTMISPALMAPVKAEAELLGGRPVAYVYNTHGDPDHLLGNGLFTQATIIAHTKVAELLADPERRESYEKRLASSGDVPLRGPDTTFDDDFELDLGGLTVRATYVGPAHSVADTVLWLPEERTYFSADTVFNGLFPLVREDLANWFAALAYGSELEPRVVVPGHGRVGDAGTLAWQRDVLERVHDAVRGLYGGGVPVDEAVKAPVPDGLRLPLAAERWPAAVRGIYRCSTTQRPCRRSGRVVGLAVS
ncbi:MAG TPA: MBL fold metallo-hydrolase [Trueperaceae bacterium]|nr:MBL fold metallo-hydrolase [Trueperaceae bacterium]